MRPTLLLFTARSSTPGGDVIFGAHTLDHGAAFLGGCVDYDGEGVACGSGIGFCLAYGDVARAHYYFYFVGRCLRGFGCDKVGDGS